MCCKPERASSSTPTYRDFRIPTQQLEYTALFEQYARVEKIKRFFNSKRQKVFKHFTLQSYHTNFCVKDIDDYVKQLDSFLMMDKKLIENFKPEKYWGNVAKTEQVGFDAFYEQLQKWAVSQETLNPEDFTGPDGDNDGQNSQVNAFRNMVR